MMSKWPMRRKKVSGMESQKVIGKGSFTKYKCQDA